MPLPNSGAKEKGGKARWQGGRQKKVLASESSPEKSHSFIVQSFVHSFIYSFIPQIFFEFIYSFSTLLNQSKAENLGRTLTFILTHWSLGQNKLRTLPLREADG